jgi:hypothetical protein
VPAAVADEAEDERRGADQVAARRREIEGEPGRETGKHASERPLRQADYDHKYQGDVRHAAATQREGVNEHDLEEDGDESQQAEQRVPHISPLRLVG